MKSFNTGTLALRISR